GRLRFLPFFHVFPLPNEIAIVRRDSDDKREINQLGSELFRPISSNRLPAFCSMTTMEEPPPPPPEYKLLLSCPSGLLSSQLSVVFDRSYDRVALPNSELEDSIAQIWEERVQRNSSLYNGKKFRYGGYSVPDGGVAGGVVTHACLHLGLTDYRTFIGTNLNPLWENFLAPSEDDATLCQHTASPLGNGAIVVTSDNEIVVLRRSENVGEFPGYFVFPGGHPENVQPGQIEASSATDVIRNEDLNKKVSEEMFDSISREVVEEIGVPATSLSSPIFIGLSRRNLNVRPAAFFFMNCSLPSKEIHQLYSYALDGFESIQLHTVSLMVLEHMKDKMPGCHQGGFELYKLMLEASCNPHS
ncbi:Nudix hydrolase 9, partial [Linum grandiflorum]